MATHISADSLVRFGMFEVDLRSGDLRKNGAKIKLQELPFRALRLLLSRSNEIVTREELRAALWPDGVYVDFDHGISSAINRLRDALGDSAGNAVFIETVERRGYRWIAPTVVAEPAKRQDPTPSLARPERVNVEGSHADSKPIPWRVDGRASWVIAGVALVILVIAAALVYGTRRNSPAIRPGSVHALAVLPLQNAGSDKDIDFLRLSLADEIATSLSREPAFSIRPSAMTSKYSGPIVDLQQAGHELKVSSIVTGHFIAVGDQLEVTLEAIDVANDRSIWRDTVRAVASDKIAMRDQVTTSIRQRLIPILGGSSKSAGAGTRPTNEEAYDLYLRSIAAAHDVVPNRDAISMLERAVKLDPNYAPAWEALGLRYYYESSFAEGGQPMLQRSDEAFERALGLDPNLGFAAGALVTNRTERGEIASAYRAASAQVKRRPDSAAAHFALGYVLRYAGLLDDAARECETALSLDPDNYQFRSCSSAFIELGNTQKAAEFVRLDSGSEWAARQAAFIFLDQGNILKARQTIQETGTSALMDRGLLLACLDPSRPSTFNTVAQQSATTALAAINPEPRYFMGSVLAFCGDKKGALRLLQSSIEQNYCSYQALRTDPLLENLRRTHEFEQLLSAAKECQDRFLAETSKISP